MRYLYYAIKTFFFLSIILFSFFIFSWIGHSWKNPIQVLMRTSLNPIVASQKSYIPQDQPNRIYHDIVLDTGKAGQAHFTVSLPKNMDTDNYYCAVVAAGLFTGQESLKYITNQENYILIAYEYPQSIRRLKNYLGLFQIRNIRENVLSIPAQLVSIVKWVKKQEWYSQKPIGLMGFSFGATFVPATFHVAEKEGISLGPSVVGYGGGRIYYLFCANLPGPGWIRKPLAYIFSILFRPIEPVLHLPHIHGNFLVINGIYDEKIPKISRESLEKGLPETKTVINLKTEHMMPEKKQLIDQLLHISQRWYQKQLKVSDYRDDAS